MIFFDEKRASELGEIFRGSIRELSLLFVERDPQFLAVRKILEKAGFPEGGFYVAGVALVSYMLSKRGEDHWLEAAELFDGTPGALYRFVEEAESLRRFREHRVKRIKRYVASREKVLSLLSEVPVNLERFASTVARIVGANPEDKTVVFASKMLLYACIAANKEYTGGERLPIPVDYRVSLVTLTSGIAKGWSCLDDLRAHASNLRAKHKEEVKAAWSLVGRQAEIPPILLDAPVWLVGGCIDRGDFEVKRIDECLEENFAGAPLHALRELYAELRRCQAESP
ncbi:N-glycosylase/DNA lyase [Thermofilum pendens]|uniref:N-glycosylase/DNA lyase n=1 Tax=Thermofilum pendens (strain DSM 2475 / Hrk 5) TaxID=368408 RepID=A1RYE6_THEPD|nr:N-glycosylase/DNA lyase [Thermofilum pendens]ABL78226.1 conserved hypothetical protein [Thermofilum pendens Hrk 5]